MLAVMSQVPDAIVPVTANHDSEPFAALLEPQELYHAILTGSCPSRDGGRKRTQVLPRHSNPALVILYLENVDGHTRPREAEELTQSCGAVRFDLEVVQRRCGGRVGSRELELGVGVRRRLDGAGEDLMRLGEACLGQDGGLLGALFHVLSNPFSEFYESSVSWPKGHWKFYSFDMSK